MKRFMLFFALTHVVVGGSAMIFWGFFGKSREGGYLLDPENKRQWILRQKGETYDYAVLGSSRAHGAFDMNLLDSLSSEKGINIGADGSGFYDNYLTLDGFLKNNNKVKKVFLVVDASSLNSERAFSTPLHPFDFISQSNVPDLQEELAVGMSGADGMFFRHLKPLYLLKYNMQVLRLGLKNKIAGKGDLDYFDSNQGGVEMTHYEVFNDIRQNVVQLPLTYDEVDLRSLKKIVELCETKNIELVGVSAPVYMRDQDDIKYNQESEANIDELLSGLKVEYIFSPKYIARDIENFKDAGHLNNQGIKKYTYDFARLMNEKINSDN